MRKISIPLLALVLLLAACNTKDKIEKHNKAQIKSDFIMENLTNTDVYKQFPEKFFPKEQTQRLLSDIRMNCDWTNKRGKFVDFFTMSEKGKNSTAFIYEYFLRCDSIRFVLIYNMDSDEPELFKFIMEPIEKPSKMIIDPSKQLMNQ